MPTVSPTVSSLPGSIDTGSLKITAAGSADGFLALLNIASNTNTAENANPNDNRPSSNDSKDQNPPDPPAAPIDVPAPIVTVKPIENTSASDQTHGAQPVSSTGASDNAPGQKNQPPASSTQNNTGNASQASGNNQQNAAVSTAAAGAPAASATDTTGGSDTAQAEQQLRAALQDQLDNIEQILLALIQGLGGAAAAPVMPAASPVAATDTAALAASPLPTSVGSDPSSLLNTLAGPAAAPLPGADEMALLKNIQQLLQQLPQAATDPSQPQTPAQNDNQNGLQALMALLQQNIDRLSQLLQQQASSGDAAPPAPAAPTAQPFFSMDDLKALLKDNIAQVRDQLKALQAQNEQIFAQAKASFQAQLAQADPSLKDALSGDLQNSNGIFPNAPFSSEASASGNNPAVVTQNIPLAPAPTDPQANVQAVFQPGLPQGGTNSSTSDNSGGGQNQPMPQSVLSAAPVGQPVAGSGVSTSSFARALSQAAQNTVLDQVVFNVKTALNDGSSKIHIQLEPADLGKLDIKLSVGADGKTGMVITADNRGTLDLLQRDAQGLARALTDAGLTMDSGSMNFNLSGGQQQDAGMPPTQAAITYQNAQPDAEDAIPGNVITRSYVVNLADGLDITI